jgi:hypothetical protein
VLAEGVVAIEVNSIVQLCKLENDFDNLGLVLAGKAAVTLSAEDSLDAFVDHMWANRVERVVE